MNDYIMAQVQQMKAYAQAWEASCQLAAKKNNGIIDQEEAKALKHIHRAVKGFTKKLDKLT